MQNVQSISPGFTPPPTTHEIGDSVHQGTLPVGPTGKVYLGGGGVPWAKRCALTQTESPSSKLLFMVLASFVNGPDEAAWPSQSTLATMTGLTARGVRNATKQLEASGRIRVERMGGDRGIRYWLEAEVSSPEVPNEGTKRSTGAQPTLDSGSNGSDNQLDRYTCPCGNSWPKSHGPVCFQCHKSVQKSGRLQSQYAARYRSAHNPGLAAPEPGKYDCLFEGDDAPLPSTAIERDEGKEELCGPRT